MQKPPPAIGTLLPSVDDLPPGCAGYLVNADGRAPDDVPVRDPEGRLLTGQKAGRCRVVATNLLGVVCDSLAAVECAPTRLHLARAIGAYRDPGSDLVVATSWYTGWWAAAAVASAAVALRLSGILPEPDEPATAGGYALYAAVCAAVAVFHARGMRRTTPAGFAELIGFLALTFTAAPLLTGVAWLVCELDGIAFFGALVALFVPTIAIAACVASAVEDAARRRAGLTP